MYAIGDVSEEMLKEAEDYSENIKKMSFRQKRLKKYAKTVFAIGTAAAVIGCALLVYEKPKKSYKNNLRPTGQNIEKEIAGNKYKFRLLRVKDEIKAIDYANIDDETFEQRREDALVCSALSLEVNDENITYVRNLDLSVYYAAQFFQICCAHGLNLQKVVTCPKCGRETIIVMEVTGKMLNMSMAIIMDRFASLAGKLDYASFMDMTLPEYNFLVDSLNAKYENR